MNKLFKLIAAVLLICLSLCGCSDTSGLNEIIDEGTREVGNSLGESYTVKYEVKSGLHHDKLSVSVFAGDFMIASYSGSSDKLDIPERIVMLDEDCYYFSGDKNEGIFFGGALISDDELTETLHGKITREELADKLGSCGFPAENMLKYYDGEAA